MSFYVFYATIWYSGKPSRLALVPRTAITATEKGRRADRVADSRRPRVGGGSILNSLRQKK